VLRSFVKKKKEESGKNKGSKEKSMIEMEKDDD
jgi:hypothetical protein